MASIEADTALRGLNGRNRVQDFAQQHEGVWAKLILNGASGANVDAYGSAIRELQGLNETARLEKSAAGANLSPGETLDLKANIARVEDLGTRALREQINDGDLVCRAPTSTEGTGTSAAPATPAATDPKASASSGAYRPTDATLAQVGKGEAVLKEGDRGPAVAEAQSLLRQITGAGGKPKYDLGGYGDKGDGVDGLLGPKTKAAIEQFKKDQGLKSDGSGTLDKDTLARMQAVAGASSLDEAYRPAATGSRGQRNAAATERRSEESGTERASTSVGDGVATGAAVGARAAGKVIGSVKEVKGPKNQLVVHGSNPNAGRTFEVPTRGQEVAAKGLRAAGVVGMAYGAAQDAKALGEAAGADSIRGDGKNTELIKEGSKVAGHWAGAAVGAKGAAAVVAPFALATGPAAPFVIGAAGVVGGVAGYFGGDWLGGKIGQAFVD
ncbi:MAG: peptidoglycan-binding protein [Deltaproteobacteria bacterium]|nr:peptidoglycan-binding protein [Deltaproteobacteria bacterium]